MSSYSIKDLEHLSGIKAHTLRIWEQRCELLSPKRTPTNIRFYDNDDLKLLLNVSVLNDHGYRISRTAKMSRQEMHDEVLRISQDYCRYPDQIQSLCLAMVDMDEARFDRVIGSAIARIGLERTMLEVVYPFLTRIGILWQTGGVNPAQEHFISNLIRQKLISAIDGISIVTNASTHTFVLFLPEGELHEIGLLFAYYMLKRRQQKVIYLGQSLPLEDLFSVCKVVSPDYVFGIFNASSNLTESEHYYERLVAEAPCGQVLAGGSFFTLQPPKEGRSGTILLGVKEFVQFVEDLGGLAVSKPTQSPVMESPFATSRAEA